MSIVVFLANDSFAQNERHSYVTAKEGDLYMFMKVGAPITPEQLYFMSVVNNMNELRVLTHFQQMTATELKDFGENRETYLDRYKVEKDPYTEEKLKKYMEGIKEMGMTRLEDLSMISSLKVTTFPSLVYLTPDGFIYRFSFMPYKSEKPIAAFWQAYEKHKDKGKKMWLEKQWSQ